MTKQRDSNIEILRILCMFLMPLNHYVAREEGIVGAYHVFTLNKNLGMLIRSTGYPALTAFVLISGYFMFGNPFKARRIVSTAIQTYVYSLFILAAGVLFHIASGRQIIESLVPLFVHDVNWFVPVYIGMCLLAPFLEPYFVNCGKEQYRFALLVAVTLLFVISTPTFFDGLNERHGVATFLTLYFVGGYIKRFSSDIEKVFTVKRALILLTATIVITYLIYPAGYLAGIKILNRAHYSEEWGDKMFSQLVIGMNKLFPLAAGVSLFWIFLNLDCGKSAFVNWIARHTFGVYLFHDHCIVRGFLWNHLIDRARYYDSPLFLFHAFGWSILIFAAGLLIDCALEKVYGAISNTKLANQLCERISRPYAKIQRQRI